MGTIAWASVAIVAVISLMLLYFMFSGTLGLTGSQKNYQGLRYTSV